MSWIVLYAVLHLYATVIRSSGITPHPFVKDEVGSFLKNAPWQHTEMTGSLSGGPMVLTVKSKYKLDGGLVFSKKFPSQQKFKDCSDILRKEPYRRNRDGVYTIYLSNGVKRRIFCDMATDGGGWTVIQRRFDGSTDFQNKSWKKYAEGFGHPGHEYWFGNDAIHDLTKAGNIKLRIDLEKFNGDKGYVQYTTFKVGSKSEKYKLTVGGFKGSLGMKDSFSYHNGMAFSTADNDNDRYSKNCAQMYGGGWWYNSCHQSNLNGKYYQKQAPTALSISWLYWKDTSEWNSLKSSKMIIKSK
ncbi:ryncolin-2-like [Crassostrea angulata]|uniref:ryncolin-2-like n=1 Tax=Magallana angulata TaxID=2784310 RepID=UPI0022B0D08C|nr:ryncolin-2-like [Crassostrea angulata]